MPSPIAHSLAGLAFAHAGRTQRWIPTHWIWVVMLVVAANLADVDFLFMHHGLTHSLAAGIVAGVAAALVAKYAGISHAIRVGVAVTLAYASHVAMDFTAGQVALTTDMPLLWPFDNIEPATPIRLFAEFHHNDRANSLSSFVVGIWRWDNVIVIAQEVVVVGGLVVLAKFAGVVAERNSVRTE